MSSVAALIVLSGLSVSALPNVELKPDPIDTHPNTVPNEPLYQTRQFKPVELAIGAGLWQAPLTTANTTDTQTYLHLERSQFFGSSLAQEWTATITSNSLLGWNWGWKKLLALGEAQEPYVAIRLGALYQPSESFATLINWQRYQILGEVGFADLFRRRRQWRLEIGVSWSAIGAGGYGGLLYLF